MRGVTFLGERKLQLAEFPDPTPGPRDVVVELKASGMCGSDLAPYRAKGDAPSMGLGKASGPVIAGHEPCGVVAAIGSAPEQATLRAASTTACIAPRRGARKPQRPFPSVASANARFDSFSRSTAASPAPGPNRVLVRTIESYWPVTHFFDAMVGEASSFRKLAVRSVPAAANLNRATCAAASLAFGAAAFAIGRS